MLTILLFAIDLVDRPVGQAVQGSNGITYAVAVNSHGAVLRSDHHVIYLGHGCDARSPQFGRGRWDYANGGFRILIGRRNIGFARQAIDGLTQGQRCTSD